MFFKSDRSPWSFGNWTSDAEFLYRGQEDGQLAHLSCCFGRICQISAQANREVAYFEWSNRGGEPLTQIQARFNMRCEKCWRCVIRGPDAVRIQQQCVALAA